MENRLKHYRTLREMSQTDLSKKAKVSRVTINEIENGKRAIITSDTMFKLAEALNVTSSELFG